MFTGTSDLTTVLDFGGSSQQSATFVALDSNGNVYITGATNSTDFPMVQPVQAQNGGGFDAFVVALAPPPPIMGFGRQPHVTTRMDEAETERVHERLHRAHQLSTPTFTYFFATYLGGSGTDAGDGIAVGQNGDIYVAGYTDSSIFLPSLPSQPGNGPNTFVAKLSPLPGSDTGTVYYPSFVTYLSAAYNSNSPVSLSLQPGASLDEVFVAGYASSGAAFPADTPPPLFPFAGGPSDAFLAKLGSAFLSVSIGTIGPYIGTTTPGNTSIVPGTALLIPLTISNSGPDNGTNVTVVITLSPGFSFDFCQAPPVISPIGEVQSTLGSQRRDFAPLTEFSCSASGTTVTVTFPIVMAGTQTGVQVIVTAPSSSGTNLPITVALFSETSNRNQNSTAFASVDVQGTPAFQVQQPDPIDFGSVQVGQSATVKLIITTSALEDLTFTVNYAPGNNDGAFTFPSQLTVDPMAQAPVVFTPIANGMQQAHLLIGDGINPTVIRTMTGNGVAPRQSLPRALPHFAAGSTWTTGIFVINTSNQSANFSIAFYDNNGNAIALPFSTGATNTLAGVIPGQGLAYYEAASPAGPLLSGWGSITADAPIVVQALFRANESPIYYEAAVPSESGSMEFLIPFDATTFAANNAQFLTGIAIANMDPATTAMITCTARTSAGTVIPNGISSTPIPISPLGHWQGFSFPFLLGQRGTIDCVSNTNIAATALRFIGTNAFSSLPVISNPASVAQSSQRNTGALPHFAAGSTWTTGIFVINTSNQSANFSIAFYDNNGNAIALPFSTGATNTLAGVIPGQGLAYYEAASPAGPLLSGWGSITADAPIVVQALFRANESPIYYEAAVPSESGSMEFLIPFDATTFAANNAQFLTGIAIANMDPATTAMITCTARTSAGTVIPNGISSTPIPISPLGHWQGFSFPFLLGQRGTIDCVSNTNVAATALRFIGTNAFSSLPVIQK